MASGSQSMTTYYAKRIVGDASAAQANSALLQTGANVVADTWILNRTNRVNTYGIKYVYDDTDGHDTIELYGGAATASAWVQLDTGDITAHKFIGALEGNADTATKLSNTPNNTTTFLRGDNTWSNTLTGTLLLPAGLKTGSRVNGSGAGIEIGDDGGIEIYHSTTPFIDFHYQASTADYSIRLICNSATELKCSTSFTAAGHIYANGGYLKSTANGNTITIGSQNTGYCHIENSANRPFYFNKVIQSDGGFTIYNTGANWRNGYLQVNKSDGGDCYIEICRAANADWRILNSGGNLYFQSNWTSAKGSYFNVLQLDYNTGRAHFKEYVYASYFNSSCGVETPADGSYWLFANSDGFFRKSSRANIAAKIDLEHKWVRIGGDDMTGSIRQKMASVTRGSAPSANQYRTYEWIDSGNKRVAQVEYGMITNGESRLHLYVLGNNTTSTGDEYGGIIIYKKVGVSGNTSATYNANNGTFSATTFSGTLNGNAATASKVGGAASWLYFNNSNEVNFGGTYNSNAIIYFGYRATDSRAKPDTYIFGSGNGTATVKAASFVGPLTGNVTGNCSGSSGSCTGNAATATKATQDGSGNTITSKYVTVDTAQTITGTKSWGTSGAGGQLNGAATNGGINSIRVGDDVWLGDCNASGIMGMKSTGTNCGFYMYNSSGTQIGQLYFNGTNLYCNKTIEHPDASVSYIAGAKGSGAAVYAKKTYNANHWYPAVALETKGGGAWQIGNYDDETLEFQYATKANRDSNTNSTSEIYMQNGDIGRVLTSGNYTSFACDRTAITNITRSGTTFTATRANGTTFTFTQQDNDTNTWRPVQNNLTSTSTTDSLSAAQGKALYDKMQNCTLLLTWTNKAQTTVANWGSYKFITVVVDGYNNRLIRMFPTSALIANKTLWLWEQIESSNYCFGLKLVSMSGTKATITAAYWGASVQTVLIYGSIAV